MKRRYMMRVGMIQTLVLGAALAHAPAAAQTGQMQAEVRGGLTVGTHSLSGAGLELTPAVSFDVVVRRQVLSSVAVYGGFFRTSFGCEEGFCYEQDPSITIVGTHGVLGLEWGPAGMEDSPAKPWVRAGVMYGSTKAGTVGDDPEPGIGIHGAAGLSVGSGNFLFMPGLSYRRMAATQGDDKGHAVALAVDLGFAYRIGGGG